MRKIILIISVLFTIFSPIKVLAIDLKEAIIKAYRNNPELNAERENLKISEQELKVARSEFLPSITISGTKSEQDTDKLTAAKKEINWT